MSEATDQLAERQRTMEDNDAKAIEVIADALGGLGYELNSGIEVARFIEALVHREYRRWSTSADDAERDSHKGVKATDSDMGVNAGKVGK